MPYFGGPVFLAIMRLYKLTWTFCVLSIVQHECFKQRLMVKPKEQGDRGLNLQTTLLFPREPRRGNEAEFVYLFCPFFTENLCCSRDSVLDWNIQPDTLWSHPDLLTQCWLMHFCVFYINRMCFQFSFPWTSIHPSKLFFSIPFSNSTVFLSLSSRLLCLTQFLFSRTSACTGLWLAVDLISVST